jgi:hypothetical protein
MFSQPPKQELKPSSYLYLQDLMSSVTLNELGLAVRSLLQAREILEKNPNSPQAIYDEKVAKATYLSVKFHYNRGPLTRAQIKMLNTPTEAEASPPPRPAQQP